VGNPYAGVAVYQLFFKGKRLGKHGENTLCSDSRVVFRVNRGQNQYELIAAEPGEGIGFAGDCGKPVCHFPE